MAADRQTWDEASYDRCLRAALRCYVSCPLVVVKNLALRRTTFEAAYTALAVDDDAPVLQRGFASLEAALRHIGIAIKAKARADRVPPSGCPSALWACCERLQPLHIEYERLATGIRTIDLPKFTPRRRIMMTPTTTAAMEQDQEENGEEREEVVTDKDTVMVPPPPTPPPRAPAPGFMSMPMAKQLPVLKAPLPPPIAAAAAAIPPPPPPATAKRQTPPPPPIPITAAPLALTTTKTAMAVAAAAVPTTTSPLFNKFTPPSRTPPTTSASSQTPSPPTSAGRPIPVPTLSPTLSSPMLSPVYVSPLFLAPPPPPRSPKRPAETTTAAEDDGQQNVKRHKSKPKVAEILAALQASMDEMRARLDAVAPVVRTS